MRPHSRGRHPIEYSLRISCELGQQFSLGETSTGHEFHVQGVRCNAAMENDCLLITASGLPSVDAARKHFYALQGHIASISLEERIAIFVPAQLTEPVQAEFSFMAEDSRCASHGWPAEVIRPWLVPNFGACVYPEHEYVAIAETSCTVPQFSYPLVSLAEKLHTDAQRPLSCNPLDEALLVAVAGYAHAARFTQWVWSFLLTVMTLEMLASEAPSGNDTRAAVATLLNDAKLAHVQNPAVDLERIRTCLREANHTSKKTAVRALVKEHCSPGIAASPLTRIYADADDCDRKVGAIYDLRSIYVHEGRVAPPRKIKFAFGELHSIATESLRHILQAMLTVRHSTANQGR